MLEDSAPSVFALAGKLLNRGDTEAALAIFTLERDFAKQHEIGNEVNAEQMRGVCLRMLGRYDEAEQAFKTVSKKDLTAIQAGHNARDWCMVPLEQGNTEQAWTLIKQSIDFLKPGALPVDDRPAEEREANRRTEYWASIGFRARVKAADGDILGALDDYRTARLNLYGHQPYELNTTASEMKIAPFYLRLRLAPRGLYLAVKASHKKRCLQIVLLTFVSGRSNFYKKMEQIFRLR